jgi:hypothetical protein
LQPVQPISVAHLPSLLAALAEAARAGPRTAERFVPPRIGILEETAARRHQFVLGRRGVGKSTLLRKIESLGDEAERVVVFVDVETLRDRPYPDVLIEMLIVLLMACAIGSSRTTGTDSISASRGSVCGCGWRR